MHLHKREINRLVETSTGSSLKECLAGRLREFLLPRFELLSPQSAYNLLFTRRTRVFELYVRGLVVACGFPIAPIHYALFISLGKKSLATFPLLLLALSVKSYTWAELSNSAALSMDCFKEAWITTCYVYYLHFDLGIKTRITIFHILQ